MIYAQNKAIYVLKFDILQWRHLSAREKTRIRIYSDTKSFQRTSYRDNLSQYTVSQKRPTFGLLWLWHTWTDFGTFWRKR